MPVETHPMGWSVKQESPILKWERFKNNGEINKRVPPYQLDEYIESGWKLGIKKDEKQR